MKNKKKRIRQTRLTVLALATIIAVLFIITSLVRLLSGSSSVASSDAIDMASAGYLSVYLIPDSAGVRQSDLFGTCIYDADSKREDESTVIEDVEKKREKLSRKKYKYEDAITLADHLKETYPDKADAIDNALKDSLSDYSKKMTKLKKEDFFKYFEALYAVIEPDEELKRLEGYELKKANDEEGVLVFDESVYALVKGDGYTAFGEGEDTFYKKRIYYTIGNIIIMDLTDMLAEKKASHPEEDLMLPVCLVEENDGTNMKFIMGTHELSYTADEKNGKKITTPTGDDFTAVGVVCDLRFTDGALISAKAYTDKVNGKLLKVTDDMIELEGKGKYNYEGDIPVYKRYGDKAFYSKRDLRVGYDFTDFILNEEGKIIAGLTEREEIMDKVRILIKPTNYTSAYHESVSLTCDSGLIINGNEGINGGETVTIAKDDPRFASTDRIYISPNQGENGTGRIKITSIEREVGSPSYRGVMEIVKENEGLVIINEVPVDQYLYGVVPSEMPASYNEEALKVQAVCARSYIYERLLHSALKQFGVNADDSPACQVYNNLKEYDSTNAAVDATTGDVIIDPDGNTAEIYYYSTSCGTGTDLSVWHNGQQRSYLKSRHYAAEKLEDTQFVEDLKNEDKFREYIDNGDTSDFEYSDGWYRWKYDTTLDIDRLNEKLLNIYEKNPALMSNSPGRYTYLTGIEITARRPGGAADTLVIHGDAGDVSVFGENSIRTVLANSADKVTRKDESTGPASSSVPSAFFYIECDFGEDAHIMGYHLKGGGFGHGIGMSQNGAVYMAKAGMDFEGIIQAYFPGVTVSKIL